MCVRSLWLVSEECIDGSFIPIVPADLVRIPDRVHGNIIVISNIKVCTFISLYICSYFEVMYKTCIIKWLSFYCVRMYT